MTVYVLSSARLALGRLYKGTYSTMPTHYPKSLRIELLLRVVRRFILAVVILPAFTIAPALLADAAPSFTSATSVKFPQGVLDTFIITATGIPVGSINLVVRVLGPTLTSFGVAS